MLSEHGDAIWRFAMARTRSPELAEEIVQETFLAALQAGTGYAGLSSERTWILAIAAHKVADHFRSRRKRTTRERATEDPQRPPDDGNPDFTARGKWARPPLDWSRSPENPAEAGEMRDALRECLDGLPPSMSEAIWLRDLLDIPSSEVCKSLGVTPTNLWSRTHRARALLRRCVERALGLEKEGNG